MAHASCKIAIFAGATKKVASQLYVPLSGPLQILQYNRSGALCAPLKKTIFLLKINLDKGTHLFEECPHFV